MFRTGIIGLGTVSRTHRNALSYVTDTKLAAVCDIRPEKAQELPEGVHFYTDYEEMLENEDLDAVHICLPHYLHYEAARACARRGISVLCEKPSTMNGEQLRQMKTLEKEYDFRLAICLQNRLNPTFLKMKEMIESGQCGRLLGLKAVAVWSRDQAYYDQAPWRGTMSQAGGGCMINQAIHTLDQMQVLGGKVQAVRGMIGNLSEMKIEVEDTAAAHVTFENGVTGTFLGTITYVKNSSIELQAVCEKGTLTIKDYGLWYAEADRENEKTLLVKDRRLPGAKTYYGSSHVELIRDFYGNLAGKGGSWVTISEEGEVILLIEGIRRSSEEGRAVLWKEISQEEGGKDDDR